MLFVYFAYYYYVLITHVVCLLLVFVGNSCCYLYIYIFLVWESRNNWEAWKEFKKEKWV